MLMWAFYDVLLVVGLILYLPRALWRRRLPHRGWSMRLGRYPASVTHTLQQRAPIWLHAVSVGEVLAAQPLIQALAQRNPEDTLLVSTVTSSGFELAVKRLPPRGTAIYFPLDLRSCVRRSLDTIHPRLMLLMESELWPRMIQEAHARGIPMAVVNGRISSRAFHRHRLVKRWLVGVLNQVDLFLMQSQEDADRLAALGVAQARLRVVGNLKWDASRRAAPDVAAIQQAAARIGLDGTEPVIVAGSTHRGEESAVLRAFRTLRASHGRLRLILAPRHLERLGEVEALVEHAGLSAIRLSQASADRPWDVGVVDTFGQLGAYFGLATVVFIGGTLIPHGGQNPLEAASLGKPLLFGPSMENFTVVAHQLLAHHAARQVSSQDEMAAVLAEVLADRPAAEAMGRRAQSLVEQFQGATHCTLDALAPLLET